MLTKTGHKYGLIAGAAVVVYMLLFYFISKEMMLGMAVYWSALIIYLIFMYRACVEDRNNNNGDLLFPVALRTAFLTFVIANAIFYVFYYILFKFDPNLVGLQMEMAEEVYTRFLGEEQAAEMKKTMTKEGFEMSASQLLFEFAKGAIGGFVLSLLIAAITRRA